eukprot:655589-Prymnesium_polylepis.1
MSPPYLRRTKESFAICRIEEPNIMMERGKRVCVEPDQCDQAPVELVKAREGMCDVAAHLTKHGHEHGHGHGHGSLSRQLEEHNDTMSSELRPPTSANPHASLLSQALKRNSSSAALPVCAQDAEQTTRSWISSRDEDTSLWRDASMGMPKTEHARRGCAHIP